MSAAEAAPAAARNRTPMEEFAWCREQVLRDAIDVLAAERRLSDASGSIPWMAGADASLCRSAAALVAAVDGLPFEHRPKGWGA